MQQLGQQEEGLRARLLDLSPDGEIVDRGVVDEWLEARKGSVQRLLDAPRDVAQRQLTEELDDIETLMQRLEEGGKNDRERSLRLAVELGQRLRWVLWLGDVLSEELTADPLALVEQELDRAQARGQELSSERARVPSSEPSIASGTSSCARAWRVFYALCQPTARIAVTRGRSPGPSGAG